MVPLFTYLVLSATGVFSLVALIDFIVTKKYQLLLAELVCLVTFLIFLHYNTGFPTIKRSFGDTSPLVATAIMLVFVCLGIFGHYFFYGEKIQWRQALKTLSLSPIIILPLLTTVLSSDKLSEVQMISLGLLSYQNGFFWKEVYKGMQEKMKKGEAE